MHPIYPTNYYEHDTNTFQEVWESAKAFTDEYTTNGIPTTITVQNCTTLYYLLYAKYGNEYVRSSDQNRFKYCIWSTIFKYGPTWEKRLEIQDKLRNLTEDELVLGSKVIQNMATNPGTAPSTDTLEELPAINSQNVNKYKKSKLDAYSMLMGLLETDVTEQFLGEFKKFFNPFYGTCPVTYETKLKEGEIQ